MRWKLRKDQRHANLEVGDVCLLNHDNKVCGTYKLCRVLTTKNSAGSLVRTVKVGYKERSSLTDKEYDPGPLTEIEVCVQRWCSWYRLTRWSH